MPRLTPAGQISRLFCVLFSALAALSGCGTESKRTSPAEESSPGFWTRVSPAKMGADEDLLNAAIRDTKAGRYPNIHGILVVKDGLLVLEEYFDGHHAGELHEIRSATKAIGSILTGIAIDKGFIQSEMNPIVDYLDDAYEPSEGWSRRSRQVQIRHLLSMMSGYDCDDLATAFACEHAMYQTDDWVQYALDLPFAYDPGEHWAYNSSSLILVGEAIAASSGMRVDEFAERYLFGPLGIAGMRWSLSPRGRAWIGGGASMTPREMAKIGLLMLNRGMWNGKRILSEEWIDKSTARQGEMPGGVDYGYAWQRGEAVLGRRVVPAFWASGNGGQYIVILPENGMVVVFTGGNYDDPLSDRPFQMLVSHILPAFLQFEPPEEIAPEPGELDRLTGVYELDFEPEAVSTVSVQDGRLRVLTPERETVDLVAHSPTWFSGDSRHGPLTFRFESDAGGRIGRFVVYGSFSRFTFVRRNP